MADISEFQNCEYQITKDDLFDMFVFEFILSFFSKLFKHPKYFIVSGIVEYIFSNM